jgi:ribosome recycling factor
MMLKIIPLVLVFSSMVTSFIVPSFKLAHRSLSTMYLSEEVEEIQMDAEDRMAKSIESVKQNLATIRTGRASANMLDRVLVPYYGVPTPINQMSSISVPSAQQLTISPFEKKMLGDVEKAIIESGLGLTPMNDGIIIRINIPSLTEQRRKEMMKMCKAIGEEGKVAIRNVRRDCVDAIKKLEKASSIGEDEAKDGTAAIQKETDKAVKIIDEVVAKKEKDVMTV